MEEERGEERVGERVRDGEGEAEEREVGEVERGVVEEEEEENDASRIWCYF